MRWTLDSDMHALNATKFRCHLACPVDRRLRLALGMTAFVGWRRLLPALAALLASQVMLLVILGELAEHAGLVPHALLLRAWAVGVPAALTLVMLRAGPPAAAPLGPLRPAAEGAR